MISGINIYLQLSQLFIREFFVLFSYPRAVGKYLQTLFVKEAECGRKAIPVDNLLVGKTRKEASRMFFEALVCVLCFMIFQY